MFATWTIGRIRGVPIELHASLLLGAGCIAVAEAAGLPSSATRVGLDANAIWLAPSALGLALAGAFVLSVILHELAHLAVAAALGGRATRLTFTVLGGTSTFEGMRKEGFGEGLVEAAGPATSVLLGIASVFAFRFAPLHPADWKLVGFHLAQLNLALALLNLVPASPLDGGRVLRVLLAPRFGDERAKRSAVFAGRLLATALLGLGLFRADPVLLLLGVFVLYVAMADGTEALSDEPVRGLRVGDAIVPAHDPISPDASLDALERRLHEERQSALLVADDDGKIVGVVGLTRLMDVLAEVRPQTRVAEIMATALPHITAPMLLEAAARHMERLRVELLPVIENDELIGVVKRELPRVLPLRRAEPLPVAKPVLAPDTSMQPE